jgi:DNA polymerase I-like protein with 3'-5' exonuclease and polymerase domains
MDTSSSIRSLVVSELNPPLNGTRITHPSQLPLVSDFFQRKKVFVYDVETNVVDDFTQRIIRTIQVGDKEEQYTIDLLAFAGSAEALKEQGNRTAPSWATPILQTLQPALDSADWLKVGVFLDFDYKTTRWCLGMRMWNIYDCNLAEKCIHAGRVNFFEPGFYSMDGMLRRYAKMQIDKTEQTGFDLETPLTDSQWQYTFLDCRLPFAIKAAQKLPLTTLGLDRVVQIENDAVPAFGEMFLNGIYLDKDAWLAIVESTKIKHAENIKTLDTFFCSIVGTKESNRPEAPSELRLKLLEERWRNEKDRVRRAEYRKDYQALQATGKATKEWEAKSLECEGEAYINYGSNPQLLEAFRKMGFGVRELPNTNDRTLSKIQNKSVIKALQAYRTTQKALTTYGVEFLRHINQKTGRVHPHTNQLGAATGRTTSTKPNGQNIDAEHRACCKARPGYKFVSVDMAGAELRILAELSGEPLMVDAFANGHDVHSIGAELIFGDEWKNSAEASCAYYYTADKQKCKCKRHKELRDRAKALNFGTIYGKEAKSFSEELNISKDDAQKILDKWRSTYKVAWKFLTELGNSAKVNLCVRSFSGRIRGFNKVDWDKCKEIAADRAKKDGKNPQAITSKDVSRVYHGLFGNMEREGKNGPHQMGNADVAKIAMGCGFDKHGEPFMWHQIQKFDAWFCNFVHDEFCAEVREDQVDDFIEMVGSCIKRAAAEMMKRVDMTYDSAVGDCWSK